MSVYEGGTAPPTCFKESDCSIESVHGAGCIVGPAFQAAASAGAQGALLKDGPVRALRTYVDKTAGFRKSEQLFVSWAAPHFGKPLTKQRLSRWIVEAIALAYESKGLRPPAGLRTHSTHGIVMGFVPGRFYGGDMCSC